MPKISFEKSILVSMKLRILISLLISLIISLSFAQLGASKDTLLKQLSDRHYSMRGNGYSSGDDFDFSFNERGSSLMAINGKTLLTEKNIEQLTEMIVKATGYDNISDNVLEFFKTNVSEISGKGKTPIDLGEYILFLDVSGEAKPYKVTYSLEVFEIPNELWPSTERVIGPADAKYVIREFSDFQCPYCVRFAMQGFPLIKEELLSRDDVRFEFHHFPLINIHVNAFTAAEAAECVVAANDPEAFWIYHDALFERQDSWNKLIDPSAYFVRLAKDLKLKTDGIESCLTDRTFAIKIDDAYKTAGSKLGIRGTPTVFLNGFKVMNFGDIDAYLRIMKMIDGFDDE